MEVIPGAETLPEVLGFVRDFADRRLGKGVVPCKDTPNFIANRIGTFFGSTVHKLTVEEDYTIEEVDALTGPLIGLPKSASYRLLDIVGLDVWALVTRNLYDMAPHDPWRDRFVLQPFLNEMVERGLAGREARPGPLQARGQGSGERNPGDRLEDAGVSSRRKSRASPRSTRRRMSRTWASGCACSWRRRIAPGHFLWKLLSDLFLYSASVVPEISDRVVEIDRAMRWGYANKLGPFELWDALGFEADSAAHRERRALAARERAAHAVGRARSRFTGRRTATARPAREYFDLCSPELPRPRRAARASWYLAM